MQSMHKIYSLLLLMPFYLHSHYDVTMMGSYKFAGSIGRRVIGQINTLKDTLAINFVNVPPMCAVCEDIDPSVLQILQNPDKSPGSVMLFLDALGGHTDNPYYERTAECKVKIAYLTIESTRAPQGWIDSLNKHYDAVAVPDIWLVQALKDCGVKIPAFVMPEICYLEEFLQEPLPVVSHHPFCFGVSANNGANKNYDLLLEAFAAEFKGDSDVVLRIHCSYVDNLHRITDKVTALGIESNTIVTSGEISWARYMEHMKSIDCYTLLSRGEGFSITPREALALGRPCIIANHTAHTTICNTGFVRAVEPTILMAHDGESYNGESLGFNFNCSVKDAAEAMRDVYENYDHYLKKAAHGRNWVRQYLGENLKAKYLSLLKPKKVVLGFRNEATEDYLVTDSVELYNKYKEIIKK